MKKIAGALASCVVLALGFFLFFNDSAGKDSPTPEPAPLPAEVVQETDDYEPSEPAIDDDSSVTQDEFDQLSQEQQDEMLEAFVLDFWEKELGLSETDAEEDSLSLEIFNRPYMMTLTECDFSKLSKEDQEKAIAEITENCRQIRSYVMSVIAEAESCMADEDYKNAEAYYVHGLQTGRELSADREGVFITRLVGMACEKAGLNGLVKLYEKTGQNSNLQMAREQLSDIEKEVEEIERTLKEAEGVRFSFVGM
ncbi:MAG: hypothetical protein ACYTBS_14795 [Planctomycetota bacterium]|jgi:hypothetical protein